MIPQEERVKTVRRIDEAVAEGARRQKACEVMGIDKRTFFRWKTDPNGDKRKGAAKRVFRKIPKDERDMVVDLCCSEKYKDCTPYHIFYTELEEYGRYLASISTIYRVLREANKLHHRSKSKPRKSSNKPPEVIATGPNQVWCWDITWLQTTVRGIYLYAYKIIDIWNKELVGWSIHDHENGDLAKELFRSLQFKYDLSKIHLHSDNGHPMKGMSLLAFLRSVNVSVSRSRPRVSNDNPFIESYFKTMKYSVLYPSRFRDLEHARSWMADFVDWYNTSHRHSGIYYLTPKQMRTGEYKEVLNKRNQTMQKAYAEHPDRWSHAPKQWDDEHVVYLNPSQETRRDLEKLRCVS